MTSLLKTMPGYNLKKNFIFKNDLLPFKVSTNLKSPIIMILSFLNRLIDFKFFYTWFLLSILWLNFVITDLGTQPEQAFEFHLYNN